MNKTNLEELKLQYKEALLNNQPKEIDRLKRELNQTGVPHLELFFYEARQWADQLEAMNKTPEKSSSGAHLSPNIIVPKPKPHTTRKTEASVPPKYDVEVLKNQYIGALLSAKKKKQNKLVFLKDELKKAGVPDSFFVEAQQWAKKTLDLGNEAVRIAESGAKRDDIAFEELSQKAKKLGGIAKSYVYTLFDNTVREQAFHSRSLRSPAGTVPPAATAISPARKKQSVASVSGMTVQPTGTVSGIPSTRRTAAAAAKKKSASPPVRTRKHHSKKELLPPDAKLAASSFFCQLSSAGIHPNSIPELKPAKSWTILMDESGSYFEKMKIDETTPSDMKGVMAALLVPDDTDLKELKGEVHCAGKSDSYVAALLERICTSRCGVIGIPVEGLTEMQAEQWLACIETLLDLILRLLPVQEEITIKLLVEQRGGFRPKDSDVLEKICYESHFHFSRAYSEKAKFIKITTARFITKKESPFNGYADAITNTWCKRKILLQKTGWKDTCLISSSPEQLTTCIDTMEREDPLSPEYWNSLLDSLCPGPTNSLSKAVLDILGNQAQQGIDLWNRYLQFVSSRLNSKAINLKELSRQVSWLKIWQPEEAQFPPKIRLLWLTIKLAEENHRGITNSYPAYRKEFRSLLDRLYREDAPLTCFAALHLAVSYTNEFDFAAARDLLFPWLNRQIEIPGLQYYGQILSSLGQHEAFLGDNEVAIGYFRKAIAAFEMLSDPDQAKDDAQKTRCYYLTALMDLLPKHKDVFGAEMELYQERSLLDAATQLSVTAEEPYRHHLLLRYLSGHPEETAARKEYLAHAAEWKKESYHPWELIEFYRAVLCEKLEEIILHLRNAYAIAMEGGETLKVIAAVILGSLLLYDNSVAAEYDTLAKKVVEMVPKLGKRGDILLKQQNDRLSSLELARAVLPFNFR